MKKFNLQETIKELKEFLESQNVDEAISQTNEDVLQNSSNYVFENLAYCAGDKVSMLDPCASYSDYDDFKDKLKAVIDDNAVNETLFELVEMYLKEKGMRPSEVYKNAQISKQDFSRYVRPDSETISRIMVFNLAIGLKLNCNETKRLLKSAGYGFNEKHKFDIIVMFCINRELYNVTFINMLLDEFEQPLLKTYNNREN